MSSPDQSKQANLVNPPKQTQMVKIRAKSPIRVMRPMDGQTVEHIVQPGEVVEVTEAEAKEFCDKKIKTGFKESFGSYEKRSLQEHSVIRAERIK